MSELPGRETRCLCLGLIVGVRVVSGSRSPQPASLVGTGTLRKMAYPAEMQLQPVPGEGLPEYYLRCAARENRSISEPLKP